MDVMPPDKMPNSLDAAELLDAYVAAEGWANGATTTKQMKAWEKRRDYLKAQVLNLMRTGLEY